MDYRILTYLLISCFLVGCGDHIAVGKWRVIDGNEAVVAIFSNGSARVFTYPCSWSKNDSYEIVLTCELEQGEHSMLEIKIIKNNKNMATYGGGSEVTLLRLDR